MTNDQLKAALDRQTIAICSIVGGFMVVITTIAIIVASIIITSH